MLIGEINKLAANAAPVALVMITNRAHVLDPAVLLGAALRLTFERPNEKAHFAAFQRLLQCTGAAEAEIAEFARITEHNTGYTYPI